MAALAEKQRGEPKFNYHLNPSAEVLAQADSVIAVVNSREDIERAKKNHARLKKKSPLFSPKIRLSSEAIVKIMDNKEAILAGKKIAPNLHVQPSIEILAQADDVIAMVSQEKPIIK